MWALVSLLSTGACGSPPPAPPPPPFEAPSIEAGPPSLTWALEDLVLPEPGAPIDDEILRSPLVRHPEFQREVARWVEYWQGVGGRWFPDYLERMAWFVPLVDSALAERDLPPSLRYLPIIESGYSPSAVSHARAVGLWQLMASTATGYGMEVGPLLDERRHPRLSTAAATDFLNQLRSRFGSWFLALAAYNSGPARVQRLVDRYAPLVPRSDSLYWEIRRYLPRETRDFVPKFFAAATVAAHPTAYGLEPGPEPLGFHFDSVSVPDATTLDVVADAAGADQELIERLNPEIVRGITPPGRVTTLRVPPGLGEGFEERYALIPPDARVTFVEHRVQSGETFSHIAVRYGVPLSELRAANPGVEPRRLQIGQRLTVPVAPRRGR